MSNLPLTLIERIEVELSDYPEGYDARKDYLACKVSLANDVNRLLDLLKTSYSELKYRSPPRVTGEL